MCSSANLMEANSPTKFRTVKHPQEFNFSSVFGGHVIIGIFLSQKGCVFYFLKCPPFFFWGPTNITQKMKKKFPLVLLFWVICEEWAILEISSYVAPYPYKPMGCGWK
jgi:hypothetical protein